MLRKGQTVLRIFSAFVFTFGFPLGIRQLWRKRNEGRRRKSVAIWFLSLNIFVFLLITLGMRGKSNDAVAYLNPVESYMKVLGTLIEGIREHAFLQRFRWVSAALEGYVFNVLLFVPLGYLLPAAFLPLRRWWKVMLLGFAFSLLIETTQLITHLGWFDATDLIHNTIGAIIGYGLYNKFLHGI